MLKNSVMLMLLIAGSAFAQPAPAPTPIPNHCTSDCNPTTQKPQSSPRHTEPTKDWKERYRHDSLENAELPDPPPPDQVRELTDEEMRNVKGSEMTDSEIRQLLLKARNTNWPKQPPQTKLPPVTMPALYKHL